MCGSRVGFHIVEYPVGISIIRHYVALILPEVVSDGIVESMDRRIDLNKIETGTVEKYVC